MHYWEHPEHARSIRGRVLAFMDERGIACTPLNYELWFAFELGQNQDLRRALDEVLKSGGLHDSATIKALHARFFSRPDERVEAANNRIQTELGHLASALATVGEGAAEYGRVLGVAGDQLMQSILPVDVQNVIERAAGATVQMEQRNKALEQQVELSTRELVALRTQLEAVREESRTDSLTGLSNRRAFDDGISAAVMSAGVVHTPLCVLLCDIDRFKLFNDTWGHTTGDQVLRLVASVLKSNVHAQHLTARYGGEELAVVLSETSLADAINIGEQIRSAIEAKKVIKKSTGESLGQITISIGAAQFIAGESTEDFVSRADRNLYMAKQLGRNRVCWVASRGQGVKAAPDAKVKSDGAAGQNRNPSLVELEFADRDTPLIVDASVTLKDNRLQALLGVWTGLRHGGALPVWRDDFLNQIASVRENAHVYDLLDDTGEIHVRFVGTALIDALGTDPTGLRYSLDRLPESGVRSTAERIFELVSLTRQINAPLRAYSKSVRHLGGRRLWSEVLLLPFSGLTADATTMLGVTIFTPVSSATGGAAA